MVTAIERQTPDLGARPALSLVDCDAHHTWTGVKDILPFLPKYWAHYVV